MEHCPQNLVKYLLNAFTKSTGVRAVRGVIENADASKRECDKTF